MNPALSCGDNLVTLFDEWHADGIPVNVIYPPNRYVSAKVRVFIDWVIALFERHEFLRRPHPGR